MSKAEFISYSFDVKAEGKGVARALDLMLHNSKNTPPSPVVQAPLPAVAVIPPAPSEEPTEWDITTIEVF